jgi:hypothetical protein
MRAEHLALDTRRMQAAIMELQIDADLAVYVVPVRPLARVLDSVGGCC